MITCPVSSTPLAVGTSHYPYGDISAVSMQYRMDINVICYVQQVLLGPNIDIDVISN